MDFEKIYNDNQFQSSVIPQGFALVFLGKDQNGNVVQKFKNSKGQFGVIAGSGVSQDTITGYVINNDDGTVYFQQVTNTENGVENIGEPKAIQSVFIPETGVDEPKYQAGSQTSCDYYKCAEVFGPKKVSCIVVSGAGSPDVNGRYFQSDIVMDGVDEIHKNENNDFYLYRQNSMWYIAYTMYANYAYYSTYSFDAWNTDYEGEEPPPTVVKEQVTVDADVPKTWDGYKAVLVDGVHTFESTVTTGLSYGTGFTPVIGTIYNSDATVIVSRLWSGAEADLIAYFPFSTDTTDTIASFTPKDTQGATIVDGWLNFQSGETNYLRFDPISGAELTEFTVALKVKVYEYKYNGAVVLLGTSLNESQTSFFSFPSETELRLAGQTTNGNRITLTQGTIPLNTETHIAITYNGGIYSIYINGVLSGNGSQPSWVWTRDLWLGGFYGYNTDHSFAGAMRDLRIYNRALSQEEIVAIADQFKGDNDA